MIMYEKLIQLRREKGYSQEQLANMLNVSRQAVSKWESGTSTPELEKIVSMADIFEVSLDYLLRDSVVDSEKAKTNETNSDNNAIVMEQLNEIKQCITKQNIFEYKSKRTVFGLPLVHIKFNRYGLAVARGIIAIGNVSIGVLSFGGLALGLISVGGLALGLLLALAGLAIGGITLAGVSIGIVAFGGVAMGIYAFGGIAVAMRLAMGGVASANIAIGEVVNGAHLISYDVATREQVKVLILEEYPNFNRFLLKIIMMIVSK